jgi:hypothetical protein
MILLEENLEELLESSAECQVIDFGRNCPKAVEYRASWEWTCTCHSRKDSSLICSSHEAIIRSWTWKCANCGAEVILLGTIRI